VRSGSWFDDNEHYQRNHPMLRIVPLVASVEEHLGGCEIIT
jgi:hypothetical protein